IQKLNGNDATNANLTGDVTSVGNTTTLTNAPVIAKVLTGYTSGAGAITAADSILSAIQKLNGNDATNANLTGVVTSVGNTTSIGNGAISNAMLANGAVANLSGTNTGDNAVNSNYSGLVTNATHTGDATGSGALTVVKINGVSLAGLATGILKNTTGTGQPSIAVAGDFPGTAASGANADITSMTGLTGSIKLASHDVAWLIANHAAAVGEIYFCTNCSSPRMVVSTGTANGDWAAPGGGSFW
ncbi:MAG TPA: hypothetical protein PKI19_10150, partial [Elusimicrobiales bacterium]|nr:hypothetical protein [Elusimicrobiales bacterium]